MSTPIRRQQLAGIVLTVATVLAPLAGPAEAAEGSDEAVKEVWTEVKAGLKIFSSMDLETFENHLADDIEIFDLDLEGNPVRHASRARVVAYAKGFFEQVKAMGATIAINVRSHSCRASGGLGFCAMALDFTVTMEDGSVATQPSYATAVVRKDGDRWKWVHWHASLSKRPEAATP